MERVDDWDKSASLVVGAIPRRSISSLDGNMRASSRFRALSAAAKLHWRHFIFAWIFPLYLYGINVVMSLWGVVSVRAGMWFLLMDISIFLLFAGLATVPLWRRRVTAMQAAFWVIIVPTIILGALLALPFKWPVTMEMLTSNNRLERSRGPIFGGPRRESMIEIKCLRLTLAKPASPNLVVRHMVQRGL